MIHTVYYLSQPGLNEKPVNIYLTYDPSSRPSQVKHLPDLEENRNHPKWPKPIRHLRIHRKYYHTINLILGK